MFTPYIPTEDDLLAVESWEKNNNTEDPMLVVVRQIFNYDQYYLYSDCGTVLRHGDQVTAQIKSALASIEDPVVVDVLRRNMFSDDRSELLHYFPWLKYRFNSGEYARLIKSGMLSPELASKFIGISKGLRTLIEKIYTEAVINGPFVVWAGDYERVRFYARYRQDTRFYGLALSKETYAYVEELAALIKSCSLREALVLGGSQFGIHRYNLEKGDYLITIAVNDSPRISFFFTKAKS